MLGLDPTDLAAMLLLGLLCWGLRVAFVLLVPADHLPAAVARALQHLAPAALASICAVELSGAVDTADLASSGGSLGIAVLASLVAIWRRSLTWTVLAGVAAVLVVDLLLLG